MNIYHRHERMWYPVCPICLDEAIGFRTKAESHKHERMLDNCILAEAERIKARHAKEAKRGV